MLRSINKIYYRNSTNSPYADTMPQGKGSLSETRYGYNLVSKDNKQKL